MNFSITGNLADIQAKKIYPARIEVKDGRIAEIVPLTEVQPEYFVVPGFVDAHVHVESSMLAPVEFARLSVVHGTVASVSDPHEIANVCGLPGVEYMIENGKKSPFKFCFGAPSCVPATFFETSGAVLNAADVERLLAKDGIGYLAEVMNFPGVLNNDAEVMKKIAAAISLNKPVDGHAPGLRGEEAARYAAAGISTDHECTTADEARDKLKHGMKILIREGSAAKNFNALAVLLDEFPDEMMFCSDDKHPDSLVAGHINQLCARAVAMGADVFNVLKAACVNPVQHYSLPVGLLEVGDPADFVILKDLKDFEVVRTYIDGSIVAENGVTKISHIPADTHTPNKFNCSPKTVADFEVSCNDLPKAGFESEIPVIEVEDGQLVTKKVMMKPLVRAGRVVSDPARDLLKIVVVNRYQDALVARAFIKNFGLKRGAIASSVAHDSHNIIAVGVDDESLCAAVNLLVACKGGISLVDEEETVCLPLPVAGLMSEEDGYDVAQKYADIDAAAKRLGSQLGSPYMSLSFMALLVIPELKLSDKGLFDGKEFKLFNHADI